MSKVQAHIIIKENKRGDAIMEKAFEELQIKDDFTRELDKAVQSVRKK